MLDLTFPLVTALVARYDARNLTLLLSSFLLFFPDSISIRARHELDQFHAEGVSESPLRDVENGIETPRVFRED